MLNSETSKKAITDVMRVLKMDDVMLRVKEKRLSSKLMGLMESAEVKQPAGRKDPRL